MKLDKLNTSLERLKQSRLKVDDCKKGNNSIEGACSVLNDKLCLAEMNTKTRTLRMIQSTAKKKSFTAIIFRIKLVLL